MKLASLPVNFKVPVSVPPDPAPRKAPEPVQTSFSNCKVFSFSKPTKLPFCIVSVFANAFPALIETVFEEGIVTSSFIVGMSI